MNPLKHINFGRLASEYFSLVDTTKGNSLSITQKLYDFEASYRANASQDEQAFLNYLLKGTNLKKIITGDEISLQKLVHKRKLRSELFWDDTQKKATPFGDMIYTKIFNYDNFRKNQKSLWLVNKLKIKSCLYCNSAYTLNSNDKIYFTFDHFFSKRKHPYLSLSLYNLIPSCDNCNRAKSDKSISITDYRHPYSKSTPLSDEFIFRLEPSGVVRFKQNGSKDEAQIKIELASKTTTAEKHDKLFDIEKQYSLHTDIAIELLWKSEIYTDSYQNDIIALFDQAGIKVSKKELKRIIISNYTEVEDFHKRPLAKLMHDISKDLGLI